MKNITNEDRNWIGVHKHIVAETADIELVKELYELRLNNLYRRIEKLEEENIQLKLNSLHNDDN